MRSLALSALTFVSALVLLAQQPNTVSTTATVLRSAAQGTATFQVQFLDANLGSTLESALTAIGSTGAAADNLSSVSVSLNQGFVVSQYNFNVVTSANVFNVTRDKLIATQRVLANTNTQALSWSSFFSPEDDDAKTIESALPALLEKAKAQALVLAKGIGVDLGKVSSISTPAVAKSGLNVVVSATVTYLTSTPPAAE